ncbi:MAG: phosphotransferase [Ktedonobacterales bacterium]
MRLDSAVFLAPELTKALKRLGIAPETVARVETVHGGLSAAQVLRLWLREPAAAHGQGAAATVMRIVKLIPPGVGWLAEVSGDVQAREVRLLSTGLLADVPRRIQTGALAWAEAEDASEDTDTDGVIGVPHAALLMRDLRSRLLPTPYRAPSGRLPADMLFLFDRLAELHARFWNDPRLADPALGLVTPQTALLMFAPDDIHARLAQGDLHPYLPLADAGWQAFFTLAAPEAAEILRGVLHDPEPVLAAINRLPQTLLHGDVWGPNMGFLPATRRWPQRGAALLLIDWALATIGPATYDALWVCSEAPTLDPRRLLAAYRASLTRRLARRNIRLGPTLWRALADAAYLRTTITGGEVFGRTVSDAKSPALRRRAEARARWWADRAALAAQRLTRLATHVADPDECD